ncbi:TonB-dependent receptor [Lewinella sp. IMCC34183]|uniref:TonB-dependent receptor n=1 Tax=Lewinella sp. IMCC34183 TaxID=2248762 RepID=UPI000E253CEB|nr:TonB-dependent receptor [Lewinella sp. IMCC34183]
MLRPSFSFCLVLLLFSPVLLIGQQSFPVEVYVLDSLTRDPLPYVNVQVANTSEGGMTDEDGRYAFRTTDIRPTLLVSSVGYAPLRRRLELSGPLRIDIALFPEATSLETVTVSSRNARERLQRPIMGVEQLNISEIEQLPVALGEVDVFRGLQLVSGVNSAGEASNGLSVRGGTIDQNLVLQDGAPIFTPTHLFGLFSVFTPDAVGSVDLYRANVPARFGGRVASVMEIKTRTPTADNLHVQGGVGLVSSRLSVETPLTTDKRLKLLAAGRAGLNDFVFGAFERLKNTRSRFGDATVKLRYTADPQNIFTLTGFYSTDMYQLDLINSFRGITAETNQYRYTTRNLTLEWLRLLNERTEINFRVVDSDHAPRVLFPQVAGPAEIEYRSRIRYQSLESLLTHRTGGDHRLSGGLQLTRYRLDPGRLDPDGSPNVVAVDLADEQAAEVSVFVEDEWSATDALTLSAGLRYSRYLQLGPGEVRQYPAGERLPDGAESVTTYESGGVLQGYGGIEPRLGLSLQLGPNTSTKAAYALNRQYLQNIFNSTTPLPSSRWKVSDNNLLPQVSQLYSAGLYQLLNGGYELSLEGYFRRVNNLLEYKPGADFFLAEQVETDLLQGEGRAYGAEVGLRKSGGNFTGQLNYAYARAFNRVAGPTLRTRINGGEWYRGYFDQPHTVNGSFTYDDGRTHRFSLNLVVQSNRPYSIPNGYLTLDQLIVPIFLERNNARLPLYHRLDFSWTIHNATMSQRRWVGDWTVTVYNLYGRKNAYNVYYQPRSGGGNADVFGASPLASYRLIIFGAPIFSISYSFKFR